MSVATWDRPSVLEPTGTLHAVELIGTQLRVSGNVNIGSFGRVSDFVAAQPGEMRLASAVILNRRGMPTSESMPLLHVRLAEIGLIGQRLVSDAVSPPGDAFIDKWRERVTVITPFCLLEATVSLYPGADAMVYLQAADPRFVPLQHVRIRWLADRRLRAAFPFALLNRSAIVGVAMADRGSRDGIFSAGRASQALRDVWNPERARP